MTVGAWDPATGPIDPAWWGLPTDPGSVYDDEWETSGAISLALERRRSEATGAGERAVLEVLIAATSPMLEATDWAAPFSPFASIGDRRSVLPEDLTDDQSLILGRLVPLITQPVLRARAADIAWTYGDRTDRAMLEIATDAYLAAPLDADSWWAGAHDAWQRALELTKRRGRDGHPRLGQIARLGVARAQSLKATDGFFVAELSEFLRQGLPIDRADAQQLADDLTTIADTVASTNLRAGRHIFREAAAWHARLGDAETERDCLVEAAELYVVEADTRLDANPDDVMVAALFVDKAIARLTGLPRRYRAAHGLDAHLAGLRARLDTHRADTLHEMTTIRSDPIDLSTYAEGSKARIGAISSGPLEVLATLGAIHPLVDVGEAMVSARKLLEGSFTRIMPGETYSSDGRKIARRAGGGATPDDVEVFAAAVRDHQTRAQMLMVGFVLPGLEVANLRFRFTRRLLGNICVDSPLVPPQREGLWASGLYRGLNGEWDAAVSILAPQLEHLVRHRLQQAGAFTKTVDEYGVQMEKGLGPLLAMDEAEAVFGPDIVFELRAMLVEQEGANLRHDVAHGLLDDNAAWSYSSGYVWWLALRLAVVPVWHMLLEGVTHAAANKDDSGLSDHDGDGEDGDGEDGDGEDGDGEDGEDGDGRDESGDRTTPKK